MLEPVSTVWLVRHAMPACEADVPAARWELGAEGRRGAQDLRAVLPAGAVLVASPEPKARQTLEPAGRVLVDGRFGEVGRDEPYGGDFRARRRAYVSGTGHTGWEPRTAVAARFTAGVRYWLGEAGRRPLVVGTHGMALTVWLAAMVDLPDPAAFWADLRLPDVVAVDLAAGTVRRVG
jgi:broad specificity phosphatase PhoE